VIDLALGRMKNERAPMRNPTGKDQICIGRVNWIDVWDVGLVVSALVVILAYGRMLLAMSYWSGFMIDPDAWGGCLVILTAAVVLLPFMLGVFLVLRTVVQYCLRRRVRYGLRVVLVAVVFVGSILSFLNRPQVWNAFMQGLEDGVRRRMEIEEARAWGASHAGFRGKMSLQGLPPGRVTVSDDGMILTITFGGGFSPQRGITVAPREMSASDCIQADRVRELEAGAWVWLRG